MITFRMRKITTEQFAILADSAPQSGLNLRTDLQLKYNTSARMVATVMKFSFETETDKIMLLQVCCEFEVSEEDWKKQITDGKVVLPKGLIDFFLVQTVGTARGVLHCKTEGTPFNALVLPPIDVSNIIKSDIELPLTQ